ncbi:LOW QUALITY PROTEIN: low-density lipoprotein receptor-related protein 11 [Neosynchiropus ocellatus]
MFGASADSEPQSQSATLFEPPSDFGGDSVPEHPANNKQAREPSPSCDVSGRERPAREPPPPHHDNRRFPASSAVPVPEERVEGAGGAADMAARPLLSVLLLCALPPPGLGLGRGSASSLSDLRSRISGVEELLEEFRKQLQQSASSGSGSDACVGEFGAAEQRIIRTKASVEQGAAFLLAPERVFSWRDCVRACCAEPRCTVALLQEEPLHCYLFNCTYRGRSVCSFAPQPGFTSYSRPANSSRGHLAARGRAQDGSAVSDVDEPPRSDAGQDVVIQLPTDWAVLDGRESVDDRGISRYEWTLLKGDSAISMKATHPGLLKISDLQEGLYTFQMTVTDTSGQKSSDNVSVTVLAPKHQPEVCTGHCSNYQFKCDDGCCIDITFACDGKQHCPDRSDEDFCPNFDGGRKSVTHPGGPPGSPGRAEDGSVVQTEPRKTVQDVAPPQDRTKDPPQEESDPCAAAPVVGPCKGTFARWYFDREAGQCKHFLYGGCQGNHNNFLQESDCVAECIQRGAAAFKPATAAPAVTRQADTVGPRAPQNPPDRSKPFPVMGGHPGPESGAILPLALGILITALLLLMIGCRLRLVRHKMKKARPLTTEESDYLINGMYL